MGRAVHKDQDPGLIEKVGRGDGFISDVYDHTRGVARKINNVCRGALLLGATEHKQVLDETDLKRVPRDLEGQIS
jgi:hypothetical protein